MKKYIAIVIVTLLVIVGISVYAANTSSDPIISLSYFEKEMNNLKTELTQLINSKVSGGGNSSTSTSSYEIVNIQKGKQVTFGESAEFIIRRGEATIVDPSNSNGIPNLTLGKDDTNNAKAGLQQLYLVPRNDGRGIIAKTDLVIMVRGNYTVK